MFKSNYDFKTSKAYIHHFLPLEKKKRERENIHVCEHLCMPKLFICSLKGEQAAFSQGRPWYSRIAKCVLHLKAFILRDDTHLSLVTSKGACEGQGFIRLSSALRGVGGGRRRVGGWLVDDWRKM